MAWAYVRRGLAREAAVDTLVVSPDEARRFVEAGERLIAPPAGEAGTVYDLVSLSSYAGLEPRQRPAAYCPSCLERVWMKLGRQVRHHYAHMAEGSTCVAATAEGALHLAAKLHLAAELRRSGNLVIARRCHGAETDVAAGRCGRRDEEHWLDGWDEVRVEHAMPAVRADITLLRRGRVIGAIEVHATHAVDETKAERYGGLGVPWIEVPAERVAASWGARWTADRPLPVTRDSALHPELWRCPRHARLHAAWLDVERNGVHRLATRIVHIYRTDGGRTGGELRTDRVRLSMFEQRRDGVMVEAWLAREDRDGGIGSPVQTADRGAAMAMLHRTFLEWVRWTRDERRAVVDSPMRWADPAQIPARGIDDVFPQRACWDAHANTYVLPPNAPAVSWPCLERQAGASLITGSEECFWCDVPERNRGAQFNAILGPVWVVAEETRWGPAGERMTRTDIRLRWHDGRCWTLPWREPWVLTAPGRVTGAMTLADRFPGIARTLADGLAGDPQDRERTHHLLDCLGQLVPEADIQPPPA